MAISSLKDVYVSELQDLYSACKQSHGITRRMEDVARHENLKAALKDAVDGIETGMRDIEELCAHHGADPNGEHCKGMEGLVAEALSDVFDEEFTDDDSRDAVIVAQYQRMAHYAIAGYGCLLAFARRIGAKDDIATLEKCLESGYAGDRRMTEVASAGINADAAA